MGMGRFRLQYCAIHIDELCALRKKLLRVVQYVAGSYLPGHLSKEEKKTATGENVHRRDRWFCLAGFFYSYGFVWFPFWKSFRPG